MGNAGVSVVGMAGTVPVMVKAGHDGNVNPPGNRKGRDGNPPSKSGAAYHQGSCRGLRAEQMHRRDIWEHGRPEASRAGRRLVPKGKETNPEGRAKGVLAPA
jgi:hypothetical protein